MGSYSCAGPKLKGAEEKAGSAMVHAHSDARYTIDSSDYRCIDCAEEVPCEASYYSAVIFDEGRFQRRNYCSGCWKRSPGGEHSEAGSGNAPAGETRPWSDVFASWRTRRPAAPSEGPKKVRFDPQLALEFFLRLGEEPHDGPGDVAFSVDRSDVEPPAEEPPDPDERADASGPGGGTDGGRGDGRDDAADPAGDPATESTAEPDGELDTASPASERDQVRFFLALLLVRKKVLKFTSSLNRGGREWLLLADRETPPRVHEVLNPGLTDDQIERVKDRLGELLQMHI